MFQFLQLLPVTLQLTQLLPHTIQLLQLSLLIKLRHQETDLSIDPE